MNRKSVQFKSAKERECDAKICQHYHAIGIPAVAAAAIALKTGKNTASMNKKSPNQR